MILRSRLRELMTAAGVDQKTLAAQTGLSPTTVGKLYRGHFNRIDNHTVVTLLKRFKLTRLDDLIEVVLEDGAND
jgi:transcriptional regulator with XRE-family HTH domain